MLQILKASFTVTPAEYVGTRPGMLLQMHLWNINIDSSVWSMCASEFKRMCSEDYFMGLSRTRLSHIHCHSLQCANKEITLLWAQTSVASSEGGQIKRHWPWEEGRLFWCHYLQSAARGKGTALHFSVTDVTRPKDPKESVNGCCCLWEGLRHPNSWRHYVSTWLYLMFLLSFSNSLHPVVQKQHGLTFNIELHTHTQPTCKLY